MKENLCSDSNTMRLLRNVLLSRLLLLQRLLGAKYTSIQVKFAGRKLKFTIPLDYVDWALKNLEHVLIDCDYYGVSWAIPKSGYRVLDIGAFLGFYTVSSSVLTGLSGVVYAVEPNKRILPVLHSNIVVNNAFNTILIPHAVCPSNGFVKLYIGEYPAVSSIIREHVEYYTSVIESIEVKCVKMSSLLRSIGYLDIVKLDLEGLEKNILVESIDELKRVETIVVEVHLDQVDTFEVEEVLYRAGFNEIVEYTSSEMPDQVIVYASKSNKRAE